MCVIVAIMKLKTDKIKRLMERDRLTYEKVAERGGLKSRQMVAYYLRSGSVRGAEAFGKALDMEPKDLVE